MQTTTARKSTPAASWWEKKTLWQWSVPVYPLPVVKPHENIDLLDRQKSREAARWSDSAKRLKLQVPAPNLGFLSVRSDQLHLSCDQRRAGPAMAPTLVFRIAAAAGTSKTNPTHLTLLTVCQTNRRVLKLERILMLQSPALLPHTRTHEHSEFPHLGSNSTAIAKSLPHYDAPAATGISFAPPDHWTPSEVSTLRPPTQNPPVHFEAFNQRALSPPLEGRPQRPNLIQRPSVAASASNDLAHDVAHNSLCPSVARRRPTDVFHKDKGSLVPVHWIIPPSSGHRVGSSSLLKFVPYISWIAMIEMLKNPRV